MNHTGMYFENAREDSVKAKWDKDRQVREVSKSRAVLGTIISAESKRANTQAKRADGKKRRKKQRAPVKAIKVNEVPWSQSPSRKSPGED